MSETSNRDAALNQNKEKFDLYNYVKKRLFELVRERNVSSQKRKVGDSVKAEDVILYGTKERKRDKKHRSLEIENRRKDYKILANLYHEEPVRAWLEAQGPDSKSDLFMRTVDLIVNTYFSDVLEICTQSAGSGAWRGLTFIEMPSASLSGGEYNVGRLLPSGVGDEVEEYKVTQSSVVLNLETRKDESMGIIGEEILAHEKSSSH
jgi:hypothetical protein